MLPWQILSTLSNTRTQQVFLFVTLLSTQGSRSRCDEGSDEQRDGTYKSSCCCSLASGICRFLSLHLCRLDLTEHGIDTTAGICLVQPCSGRHDTCDVGSVWFGHFTSCRTLQENA